MAAPAFGAIGTQLQGSGSAMNVAAPASVAVGNVLVVAAFIDTAGATVTAMPSGWANAPDSPITGPDNHKMYVMYKVADSGDTGGGTFNFTLSSSVYRNAACTRYTGADTSTPWDVTASGGSNASSTTTPDVADTTTVADTLLVWSATNWSGGTWTPPSGFTERRDSGDGVCSSADKVQAASGSTGSIVGTCTGSDKRTAWMGALKAASSGITGTATETQDNQTSTASGWITVTGTSARTQANQTSTATGVLGYSGTSARTEANDTSAASGWITVTGSVARTQANQTSSASGTVSGGGVSGSAAVTQANQTSTATGVLGYTGTSARTQANQTSTASGISGIAGTSARTQANQTSAAVGVLGYSGTSVRTQANQTATASGWISVTGTVARTQANQTASAFGTNSAAVAELRVLPLYSTRTFGADGYRVGENQMVWLPTDLKVGAPLLVVCHGTAAEASWYGVSHERYRPLEAIADTGVVVVAGDLGEPANADGWGNDLSVARVWEVVAWAHNVFGCSDGAVHLRGESAGGATALNAARDRPEQTASVHLAAGVCDIEAIYQGGAGNAILVDLINLAYTVGGGWPAQRATHDPALNTAELVPMADKIRLYYTPNDGLVPPAATIDFAADVGCELIPVGDMPHSDEVLVSINPGDLTSWMWDRN